MENLLEKLNKDQKEAVIHENGPLLIVAGAGTGKTTVITQRISWLILEKKIKPDEILALTFTEKAAGEMEERVDQLLPYGYVDLWISTFHAFCERVLQDHAIEIGLPGDFKLLNQTAQWLLVRQNLERFDLDYYRPLGNPTKFIHTLLKHFSRAKDEEIWPEDYLGYVENLELNKDSIFAEERDRLKEVAKAYGVYQQLLLENNFLDFGDLINYTLKLFRTRLQVLEEYRKKFKYILVDEFQDTNWAQYALIKMLSAPNNNLTVVGDDDQCLPGNTLVDLPKGRKKIEEIKEADEIICGIGKGHLGISRVKKVIKNKKNVRYLEIKTRQGKKIKVTDNHKMFFYLPNYSTGRFYVYLMYRQELGYRIGITNNLAGRLRLERSSDSILALASFKTEKEARYYETLWSLKYGIPTSCFKERGKMVIDETNLKKLYSDMDVKKSANNIATDLKKDLNFHHFYLAGVNRGGKVRLKINLEICSRRNKLKNLKNFPRKYEVLHSLSIETSDSKTIKLLKINGFGLTSAKKGYRLRKTSVDLETLANLAGDLKKITGGLLQENFKIAVLNSQSFPSLVVPAKNLVEGLFIPVRNNNKLIYDEIVEIKESFASDVVYDLEIERTHNFIANGIAVHNSIYKFRGASVSNILQFKNDFPEADRIVISDNYRSKQKILDYAYKFIKQNDPNRLEAKLNISKKLEAKREGEGIIEHFHVESAELEAKTVADKILELKKDDETLKWNDFAVLVRANSQAELFMQAFDRGGIPYQFLASAGLYSKPIILDIIAYLKILDDYHESSAVYRILNMPLVQLDYEDIVKLNYFSRRKNWSLYETLKNAPVAGVSQESLRKINKILGFIEKHAGIAREKGVGKAVYSFLEDFNILKDLSHKAEVGDLRAVENIGYINQFLKKIEDFERTNPDKSAKKFLAELNMAVESGEEGVLSPGFEEGPETVKILTVHGAKGLEFKYVFIVNLVDLRFPSTNRKDPIELPGELVKETIPEGDIHLEEERRLFYVALTRGRDGVFLTSASDYGGQRKKKISRFLVELGFVEPKTALMPKEEYFKGGEIHNDTREFKISLPSKFSFTQLKAFETCPLQYKFAHILAIPVRGKFVFSFGKTMHSALQKFFEQMLKVDAHCQKNLFGNDTTDTSACLSLDDLLKIYEETWINDWYDNKAHEEEYKKQGRQSLREFYKINKDNWPKVKYLELGFNLKIGDYTVRGAIDRIDKNVDGSVELVDYKTGSFPQDEKCLDRDQLLIYQLAASEIFNENVTKLSYYYLSENKTISFLGTPEDLSKTKEKIIATIEKIKQGGFLPKPSLFTCKNCDFKDICEHRVL